MTHIHAALPLIFKRSWQPSLRRKAQLFLSVVFAAIACIVAAGMIAGGSAIALAAAALVAGYVIAAGMSVHVMRQHRPLSLGHSRAWRLNALSITAFMTGICLDLLPLLGPTHAAVPAAAMVFFVLGIGMLLAALLNLPFRPLDHDERGLLIVDLAGIGVFTALLSAVVMEQPADWLSFESVRWTGMIAYQTMSGIVVWALINLTAREWHSPMRDIFLRLSLASIVGFIGDQFYFSAELSTVSAHLTGNLLSLCAVSIVALSGYASIEALRKAGTQPILTLRLSARRNKIIDAFLNYWFHGLVALGLGIVLWFNAPGNSAGRMTWEFLAATQLAAVVILVVRQQLIRNTSKWLKARYTHLMGMPHALYSANGLEGVARSAFEELRSLIAFDACSITLTRECPADTFDIYEYVPSPAHAKVRVSTSATLPDNVAEVMRSGWPAINAISVDQSWIAVPLVAGDAVIGVMHVTRNQGAVYTTRHAEVLLAFAGQLIAVITSLRMRATEAKTAAVAERARLSRELHDSVSQQLFASSLMSRTAQQMLAVDAQAAAIPLAQALDLTEGALAEMRALIFELRPESLHEEGLTNAFRKQAVALGTRHHLEIRTVLESAEPELGIEAKEALYRIGMEAIQNAVKHAKASRINVRLLSSEGKVTLEISDNGAGFDATNGFPGHLGLKSMRERVQPFSGSVTIVSSPGQGTTVRAEI
jgi:signal transduction histidine kinase